MKTERQRERMKGLCICNALSMSLNAGATMDVETVEMNVYVPTTMVTVHLRL